MNTEKVNKNTSENVNSESTLIQLLTDTNVTTAILEQRLNDDSVTAPLSGITADDLNHDENAIPNDKKIALLKYLLDKAPTSELMTHWHFARTGQAFDIKTPKLIAWAKNSIDNDETPEGERATKIAIAVFRALNLGNKDQKTIWLKGVADCLKLALTQNKTTILLSFINYLHDETPRWYFLLDSQNLTITSGKNDGYQHSISIEKQVNESKDYCDFSSTIEVLAQSPHISVHIPIYFLGGAVINCQPIIQRFAANYFKDPGNSIMKSSSHKGYICAMRFIRELKFRKIHNDYIQDPTLLGNAIPQDIREAMYILQGRLSPKVEGIIAEGLTKKNSQFINLAFNAIAVGEKIRQKEKIPVFRQKFVNAVCEKYKSVSANVDKQGYLYMDAQASLELCEAINTLSVAAQLEAVHIPTSDNVVRYKFPTSSSYRTLAHYVFDLATIQLRAQLNEFFTNKYKDIPGESFCIFGSTDQDKSNLKSDDAFTHKEAIIVLLQTYQGCLSNINEAGYFDATVKNISTIIKKIRSSPKVAVNFHSSP